MSKLARAVLDFEAEHPGEVELDVQMPGAAWARLVQLARRELGLKPEAASSPPADRPTGFPPPAGQGSAAEKEPAP